jgi:hypothetical protein
MQSPTYHRILPLTQTLAQSPALPLTKFLGNPHRLPPMPLIRNPALPLLRNPALPLLRNLVLPLLRRPALPLLRRLALPLLRRPALPLLRNPMLPLIRNLALPLIRNPVHPLVRIPKLPLMRRAPHRHLLIPLVQALRYRMRVLSRALPRHRVPPIVNSPGRLPTPRDACSHITGREGIFEMRMRHVANIPTLCHVSFFL